MKGLMRTILRTDAQDDKLLDLLDDDLRKVLLSALESIEADRGLKMAELAEGDGTTVRELEEQFSMGFGAHEALDRTSLMVHNVDTFLCEHPTIVLCPKKYKLAMLAQMLLAELYQECGGV